MDARTAARIATVQALYEQEVNFKPVANHDVKAKELAKANEFSRINKKMFSAIFGKACEEVANIDETIKQHLTEEWSFERIGGVMRCILRAALAENMLGEANKKVIIAEYVAIADSFYDQKEVKFVNAILDKMCA
jgi:N utilization substance protein B